MTRSQKALLNIICEFGFEVITAICGFILPRLILVHFGSEYNGITQSISQFIGCIAIMKSGIGSVTRAALYKPLAENDRTKISEIINATEQFMHKIAYFFIGGVFLFATMYPLLVKEDFNWLFSFTLVLILSISTFAQYFFGLTYQMVLQADQRNYIISIVQSLATIFNAVFASMLILTGFSIHIVKLLSAIAFAIPPIFYMLYVKKKYNINKKAKPNYQLISQRWDAFGHQVANFITTNTDIMLITIFLNVREVSVYTVYCMIINAVKQLVTTISTGTTAAFGNMLAQKENQKLKERFSQYEILIFGISTVVFTTTMVLIVPFISLYTRGINDVEYVRPIFSILLCVSGYLMCIRLPYEQIIYAAGEFKKTKNGAYAEAAINIVVSIIALQIIGINGVIIGTIVAIAYRNIRYSIFVAENIVIRSRFSLVGKLAYSLLCSFTSIMIFQCFVHMTITSYFQWFAYAFLVFMVVASISIIYGIIFYKKYIIQLIKMFKGMIRK